MSTITQELDLDTLAQDPAHTLLDAKKQAEQAERVIAACARQLHASGWTWAQIADLLGITRQTASARYSRA